MRRRGPRGPKHADVVRCNGCSDIQNGRLLFGVLASDQEEAWEGVGDLIVGNELEFRGTFEKAAQKEKKKAVIAENFECTSPRRILCLLRRLHNQSVLQSMNQSMNKSIDQSESRLVGQ